MPATEGTPSVATTPARNHVLQMGEHRQAGGAGQTRVEADIDRAHQGRDVGRPLGQPVQDRRLAALAVADIGLHEARRVADDVAMARQIDALVAAGELVERRHVVAHRPVGRRDDRGRPAHHVVAGKHQVLLAQRKRHVVGGVAGRRDGFEREAVAAHHLAVGERLVGAEIGVVAGVEARRLADMQRPRRPVRSLAIGPGAGQRLDARRAGRVVAVGMRDDDMGDGLVAHRVEQRLDVARVVRARDR